MQSSEITELRLPPGKGFKKYPWGSMEIGSTFTVWCNGITPRAMQSRMACLANGYGKYHNNGKRFKSEQVMRRGEIGIRMRRVA
jgi:hypothetical protein